MALSRGGRAGGIGYWSKPHQIQSQRKDLAMKLPKLIMVTISVGVLTTVGCGDNDDNPASSSGNELSGTWVGNALGHEDEGVWTFVVSNNRFDITITEEEWYKVITMI